MAVLCLLFYEQQYQNCCQYDHVNAYMNFFFYKVKITDTCC